MAKDAKKEKDGKEVAVRKPAEVLSRWEDLDRLFEDFWRRPFPSLFGTERWWPAVFPSMRMPSVDLYEEKDEIVVKSDLPGMSKEDVTVQLSGDTLTIKGEKKKEEEVKEKDYHRRERSYGEFVRTLTLPCEVKGEQVKATFKDGVLEIRLPKSEEAKKKSVQVKID
jgi:HSP20 family protein